MKITLQEDNEVLDEVVVIGDRAASLNRLFIPFLPSPSVTLFIV